MQDSNKNVNERNKLLQKKIKQAKKYLEWEKPNQAIAELKPTLDSKQIQQEYKWVPYHMMGIALSLKGEHEASAGYLEKAVKFGSKEPETYHMLSVNYYNLACFEEAEKFGRQAVEMKSDFLKAWLNLGSVYRSQAKLDEALECYQKANEIDPSNAGVAFRIGEIYRDQGDLKQAMKLFDITLQIESDHIRAMLEKADIYKKRGNLDQALENLEEARDLHGDRTAIVVSEAEIYKSSGKYDKAIGRYEELLEKNPESGVLRVNYALCLQEVGRFDQSEKHYRRAISDMNNPRNAISNYLMGLHYNPNNSRKHIYNEHLKFGKAFKPKNPAGRVEAVNTNSKKKLRVGFISGGFRRHPVGWMIAGALEQLPGKDFELYCYTTNNKFDFLTRRIHQNINIWRSVVGYSADVIENIIRDDDLDILVDLSGHAADNCLDVMANEPAPVIVKWVGGLFNTTGLEAFDYLITDEYESPEGEEQYYTEKLVRMPDDYICFTPPAYAPDVTEVPAKENGYVTFGCFNNPTKVNEVVLRQWAEILQQVPGSHLYLKSKQYETASFCEQILQVMDDEGIGSDRIEFEGHSSHDDHLGAYNNVDIALDPWPYSGGLTTCESLYMGLPVITMPGPTFAGRHSTTHLINAGLEHWVTDSWEEYTEKAVALANDLDELGQWRTKLRDHLLNSPVCDGKRFGGHLSVAFREMWKQRVTGYKNGTKEWQDHINIESLSDTEIEELTDGPDVTPLITIKDEAPIRQKNSSKENQKNETMNESVLDTKELAEGIEQLENGNGSQKTDEKEVYNSANNSTEDSNNENYSIETKDGVTICMPADTDILTTYVLLEQEEWFESELNFVRDYLEPGMTILDAGAGFGVYSLPMAKQVGPEGAVYAFEPGVVAKKHLEMSKMENNFDQLEVVGRGLADKAEEVLFETAETPELNWVSENGEESVSLTSLDAWWGFAGKPEIDFLKVDVNGMEADVLAGGSWMFEETKPVVLAAIGENEENFSSLQEQLKEFEYQLFEYIPGPGVLAEYDPEAGIDPFQMNVIAISEGRIQEFKENGWIFDESVEVEAPGQHGWKEILKNQPWAESKVDAWADKVSTGNHEEYLEALNLACAAEQMDVSDEDPKSKSRKGAAMLMAAQKLIGLFNNGQAGVTAAMTYVRLMSELGKQSQAVEMAKQLMETVNSGQDISVELPFLPPLPEQNKTDIQTDFSKWLTVRVVEAWITLQNPTTYMAGEQELGMLEALEGNPEVLPKTNHIASDLISQRFQTKSFDEGSKPSGTFVHVCFNHVYAKSLSDLLQHTNENSSQEHWLFVEQRRAIPSYSADISDNSYSTFFDKKSHLKEVLYECRKSKVDGVFIHGLFFDWQKRIINEVGDHKHIAWKYWGGDLYNPIKQGQPLHDLIAKVDSVHGKVEGDFEIIKETYGEKQEYRFGYAFPGLYGDWPEEVEKDLPPIITVGNSGDPSNNHIEILKLLAEKKDITDYQLHLPVAYNLSRPYRDQLIRSIKGLGLADITRFQESFIPPREYMKMIMRGSMLIVAHNRQQALGNILASIYSGNNTFVKRKVLHEGEEIDNPTWRFIEDYNLKAQPFEDLLSVDRLSEISTISKDMRNKHQKLIKTQAGLDARSQPLVEACNQIIKENKAVAL